MFSHLKGVAKRLALFAFCSAALAASVVAQINFGNSAIYYGSTGTYYNTGTFTNGTRTYMYCGYNGYTSSYCQCPSGQTCSCSSNNNSAVFCSLPD